MNLTVKLYRLQFVFCISIKGYGQNKRDNKLQKRVTLSAPLDPLILRKQMRDIGGLFVPPRDLLHPAKRALITNVRLQLN